VGTGGVQGADACYPRPVAITCWPWCSGIYKAKAVPLPYWPTWSELSLALRLSHRGLSCAIATPAGCPVMRAAGMFALDASVFVMLTLADFPGIPMLS